MSATPKIETTMNAGMNELCSYGPKKYTRNQKFLMFLNIPMKNMQFKSLLAALSISLLCNVSALAQGFSGPETCAPGSHSYSYGPDENISGGYFYVSGGGSAGPTTFTGSGTLKTAHTTVTWTSTGIHYLYFTTGGGGSGSLQVNVTCGTLAPNPDTSQASLYVQIFGCSNTRLGYSGSPSSGTWYWQTSSTGTSTEHPGVYYNIDHSGTYYLRARNSSGCWTPGSSPGIYAEYVTVGEPTGVTGGTRCGPGQVQLHANAGPSGTQIEWYNSGGSLLAYGTSYTATVSSTSTYYAKTRNIQYDCVSYGTPAVVTVNPLPANAVGQSNPSILCGPGYSIVSASGAGAGQSYLVWDSQTGGSLVPGGYQYFSATTTWWVEILNNSTGCKSPSRSPVTVTVDPAAPTVYSTSGSGSNYDAGTSTYSYSTVPSGVHVILASSQNGKKYQLKRRDYGDTQGTYQSFGALKDGQVSGSGIIWDNLPSGEYIVEASNPSGYCVVTMTGNVKINLLPEVTSPDPYIPYGGSTQVSTSDFASWQWLRNGVDISGATQKSYTAHLAGTYQVRVREFPGGPEILSSPLKVGWIIDAKAALDGPYVGGFNLISSTNVFVEGVKTIDEFYTLLPHQFGQSIVYKDGLGRPFQNVMLGESPTGNDLVQPVGYSQYGLAEKSYLGYEADSRDGRPRYYAIKGASDTYASSDQYDFYQTKTRVAHDTKPYAEKKLSDSPLGNVKEQGAPGAAWQPGTGHSIKNDFLVNTAAQVRYWKSDGTTNSYYVAKSMAVQQTTDENGNQVRVFTDKVGRTILKQVQLDENQEGVFTSWLETYYIYDIYGNLIYQVPPKAMAVLGTGSSLNANNTSVAELVFKNTYDERGRLVEKKVPGAVPQYYIYDKYDRLILTQDGNLRGQNKWLFAKYDSKDRPIMLGLYTNTTETTRAAMQALVDTQLGSGTYFESRGTTLHGYTNVVFPTTNAAVLSVNYYDNYDFDFNGTDDFAYTVQGLTGENSQGSSYMLPTGGKRLILGTSDWLYNYVFYDEWGRAIQVRSNNHMSLTVDNLTTTVYDYRGKVLTTKNYHNAGGSNQTTILQNYVYDHRGRLDKISQRINGGPEFILAQYVYNALGQMIEKNLHCANCSDPELSEPGATTGGTLQVSTYNTNKTNLIATQSITLSPGFTVPSGSTFSARIIDGNAISNPPGGAQFLQSVDYRYNIRGWMESINNAELADDGGTTNNDDNDFFGMNLLYNTTEAGLSNAAKYNGNISAIKWKASGLGDGDTGQRAYKYTYDKADRLKLAEFNAHSGTAWNKETNTLNESMTYDANGNIMGLQRKTVERTIESDFSASSVAQLMDDLTYTYTTATNSLASVEDSATEEGGFTNGAANTIEYAYTDDGSITKDDNKGISAITYNDLGKPDQITFTDGRVIQYTYDAAGTKLKMALTQNATTVTTDYAGSFVYTDNNLNFFSSPEGRVVKKDENFEYQYAITDHQGNTRLLFSSKSPAPDVYTATFETGTQTKEQSEFENYPTGAWHSPVNLYDHTDAGTTYTYSQLLNGASSGQVGLAKTLKVFPGDTIKAEVYAKYFNNTSTTSNLAGFATALTAAFGLTSGATGEALKAYTGLQDFGSVVVANGGSGNTSGPKAFITVLQFDQNFNFVDVAWDQIDPGAMETGSGVPHDLLTQEVVIKEAGYAYIYVSNENPTLVDVYFDDLKITHSKSSVLQYNEYYPFGLQTANSWTREDTSNDFLYNSATELNSTTGMYDLFYRNYDPALGRFHQVDPMAARGGSQSPFVYGFNSPGLYNDPMGDWSADPGDVMDFGHATSGPGYQAGMQPAIGSSFEDWFDTAINSQYGGNWNGALGSGRLFMNDMESMEAGLSYTQSFLDNSLNFSQSIEATKGHRYRWRTDRNGFRHQKYLGYGFLNRPFYIAIDVLQVPQFRSPVDIYNSTTFGDTEKLSFESRLTLKYDPNYGLGFQNFETDEFFKTRKFTVSSSGKNRISGTIGDSKFSLSLKIRKYSITFNTRLENDASKYAVMFFNEWSMMAIVSPVGSFDHDNSIIAIKRAGVSESTTMTTLFGFSNISLGNIKMDSKKNRSFRPGRN